MNFRKEHTIYTFMWALMNNIKNHPMAVWKMEQRS